MSDVSKIFVALFVLAIVSVLAANSQTSGLITSLGQFLVSMVKKVEGS